MPKYRKHKHFYHIFMDSIDQAMFLCDTTGIDISIVSFQDLNLTCSCTRVLAKFFEQLF